MPESFAWHIIIREQGRLMEEKVRDAKTAHEDMKKKTISHALISERSNA